MGEHEGECELVELDAAAAELSTTGLRLLMLLREGVLQGVDHDGTWQITRDSLERLRCAGITAPVQKGCAATCKVSGCNCS